MGAPYYQLYDMDKIRFQKNSLGGIPSLQELALDSDAFPSVTGYSQLVVFNPATHTVPDSTDVLDTNYLGLQFIKVPPANGSLNCLGILGNHMLYLYKYLLTLQDITVSDIRIQGTHKFLVPITSSIPPQITTNTNLDKEYQSPTTKTIANCFTTPISNFYITPNNWDWSINRYTFDSLRSSPGYPVPGSLKAQGTAGSTITNGPILYGVDYKLLVEADFTNHQKIKQALDAIANAAGSSSNVYTNSISGILVPAASPQTMASQGASVYNPVVGIAENPVIPTFDAISTKQPYTIVVKGTYPIFPLVDSTGSGTFDTWFQSPAQSSLLTYSTVISTSKTVPEVNTLIDSGTPLVSQKPAGGNWGPQRVTAPPALPSGYLTPLQAAAQVAATTGIAIRAGIECDIAAVIHKYGYEARMGYQMTIGAYNNSANNIYSEISDLTMRNATGLAKAVSTFHVKNDNLVSSGMTGNDWALFIGPLSNHLLYSEDKCVGVRQIAPKLKILDFVVS